MANSLLEKTLSIPFTPQTGRPDPARPLEALRPVLKKSAAAVLRRAEDVEDAVQEALLRLVRHFQRGGREVGDLEALGRVTARRVALDMVARRRPLNAPELDPPAPEGAPPLEADHVRGRLRKAVDELPDPQRAAFLLVHQEALTHEQAAKELGITPETLRARLYRARCRLRERLKDLEPGR